MSWKHVYQPSKTYRVDERICKHVSHQPAVTTVTTVHSQGQARVESIEESTTNSFVSPQNPNDICRQFDSLRDRLGKVSIPENFKVNDSPMGVKQESKPCLKVISKTARHAETGLKVLANIT